MKFSISIKLLSIIIPLVCLPVATVGYFSFKASEERVERLVKHEQMVQARATAKKIDDIFYYCRLDMDTISSLPILEDFHNAKMFRLNAESNFIKENIIRIFKDFITRNSFYSRIGYLDATGRTWIVVGRNSRTGFDKSGILSGTQQDGTEKIHVSNITRTEEGLRIYWSKAIFGALGSFAGIAAIELDYDRIVETVSRIRLEEKGYAFLIDELGRLIAHPRFEPFSFHIGNYPDDDLKKMILEMMEGKNDWSMYEFEGEEKVAAFAPIPMMKWSVAVTIPKAVFKNEALKIRTKVIQTVTLTLIVAVATVLILTYILLKPVRTLVDGTKRIASGDLDHEIPITSTDELGELTRSFNLMVKNLARIQEELVRSEKLISLGRLSAGVAHEIRNPLNAIKGAVVFMRRKRPQDPLIDEYTRLVSEEIDRLNRFVTEFLYFARQSEPRPIPTEMNRLIKKVQRLFEKKAAEDNIRIHNQFEENIPLIMADPGQIEQVIVNLLINAMDAMPEGGDITLATRVVSRDRENDWRLRITVSDNGCGIAADQLKNIFDPFYSTKEGGTGLGLPLSLGIIENHNGSIRIRSEEGIGTTVTVELPIEQVTA